MPRMHCGQGGPSASHETQGAVGDRELQEHRFGQDGARPAEEESGRPRQEGQVKVTETQSSERWSEWLSSEGEKRSTGDPR